MPRGFRQTDGRDLSLMILCLTVTAGYGVLIYAFPVLIAPMERGFGWSGGELSAPISISLLVSGAAAIPVGRILDRSHPRAALTGGGLLAVLGLICWSQVHSLWQLYVVFVLIGAAMSLVLYPPAFTLLSKSFVPSPGRALTVLTLVGGTSSLIFTPVAAWFLAAWGWRGACLGLAALAAVLIVLPYRLLPAKRPTAHNHRVRSADGAPVNSVTPGVAFRQPAFWCLTTALFLGYFINLALVIHFVPYLLERHFSLAFAAFAAGLLGLMQLPGRAVMLPMSRRLPRAAVTSGVFALEAISLVLLAAPTSGVLIIVF